jgi:hypothetical protein
MAVMQPFIEYVIRHNGTGLLNNAAVLGRISTLIFDDCSSIRRTPAESEADNSAE